MHPVTRTTTWIAFLLVHSGLLAAQTNSIEAWVTNPDRSALFQKLPDPILFRAAPAEDRPSSSTRGLRMQTIDGFGYALTGGSAELLMKMTPAARVQTLRRVFGRDGDAIGVSLSAPHHRRLRPEQRRLLL